MTTSEPTRCLLLLEERRQRRSAEQGVALRYQLERTRERGGLKALVLADAEGLSVAAAGDARLCAELSAVAPLLGRSPFGFPMPSVFHGSDVAVRPFAMHGQELFLAALGGNIARDALLASSVDGVQRILTSN